MRFLARDFQTLSSFFKLQLQTANDLMKFVAGLRPGCTFNP
jgi:hypothetical protein